MTIPLWLVAIIIPVAWTIGTLTGVIVGVAGTVYALYALEETDDELFV